MSLNWSFWAIFEVYEKIFQAPQRLLEKKLEEVSPPNLILTKIPKLFKKFNQSEKKSNLSENEPFVAKNVSKLVILGHF